VLVYETFARGHERFGKPSNPAFLLEPGELLRAVSGKLRVVAFEGRHARRPRRAAHRRRAARMTAAGGSVWMEGVVPTTTPLTGDVDADVAIVGAGFTGLSAAIALRAAGTRSSSSSSRTWASAPAVGTPGT
jgi:hypothetical protein